MPDIYEVLWYCIVLKKERSDVMPKRRPSGDGMVRKRMTDGRWEGRIVVGHKENGLPIYQTVLASTQKELTSKLNSYRGAKASGSARLLCESEKGRSIDTNRAIRRRSVRCSYSQYSRAL